jgi:G3E family GTPase
MGDSDDEAPMLVDLPGEGKVVPVTILTGFLGAGKTTLLNYLLTENHGKRLAVIENEFSSGLGIEGMIAKNGVDGGNLDGFFELNNGCICCTIKDDLLTTLEQLVLHKDRFDYVLIETTGVANPGPVINTFWSDDEVGSTLKLDGVVCVVDSMNVLSYLEKDDLEHDVKMQICYADRILLNKSETLTEIGKKKVMDTVMRLNGMAEVRQTTYSKVTPEWVLDIDCYSTKDPTDMAFTSGQGLLDNSYCVPCDPAGVSSTVLSAAISKHSAERLTTLPMSISGELDSGRLNYFLDEVLYVDDAVAAASHGGADKSDATQKGNNADMALYRMKGVLHIAEEEQLHVLQAVHDTFDIKPSSFARGGTEDMTGGESKIIVIGRNLDANRLYQGIKDCTTAK